jgi:hypothetical protein
MPDADHDRAVPFDDVVLTGDLVDTSTWECWTHRDEDVTHYYARGRCPACGARSQGHIDNASQPIESQGPAPPQPPRPTPAEPVEIPVRCRCGHDHGRPGQTSCGRRWSIHCPPTQP